MALSYEQLTELLTTAGDGFKIEEVRPDGKTNIYRGADLTAFLARGDNRRHEHKVYDSHGQLVYRRDINGRVYEGNASQHYDALRKQKVGSVALTALDIFRDSLNNALRIWGIGGRRR